MPVVILVEHPYHYMDFTNNKRDTSRILFKDGDIEVYHRFAGSDVWTVELDPAITALRVMLVGLINSLPGSMDKFVEGFDSNVITRSASDFTSFSISGGKNVRSSDN